MNWKAILLCFLAVSASGQDQLQKDSLTQVMCSTFLSGAHLDDSVRLRNTFVTHMPGFLSRYQERDRNAILQAIYIRLQRNCPDFKAFLDRIDPPKGDWKTLEEKPVSKLTSRACRDFLKHDRYAYVDAMGDTVRLELGNGYWIDRFSDGTYSRLAFRWIDDCSFEIEFIESDNHTRQSFSKPGDVYVYQVNEKHPGYYDVSVEIKGTGRYAAFRIYY